MEHFLNIFRLFHEESWITTFTIFAGVSQKELLAANALATLVMGCVILWVHRRVLPEQSWAQHAGVGFLIFSFQYSLSLVSVWIEPEGTFYLEYVVVLGSAANNFFFLVSARSLCQRKRVFKVWVCALPFAVVVAQFLIALQHERWSRAPDALFSALTFIWFGYALYLGLGRRQKPSASRLAFVIMLFYALLSGVYACLPFLSFGPDVRKRFAAVAAALGKQGLKLEQAVAAPLMALTLGLKLLMFSMILVLMLRSVAALAAARRRTLDSFVDPSATYLSSDGIVQSIGIEMGADFVELCLRVPGSSHPRLSWYRWAKPPKVSVVRKLLESLLWHAVKRGLWMITESPRPVVKGILQDGEKRETTSLRLEKDSFVGESLATGKEIRSLDLERDGFLAGDLPKRERGMRSASVVPIRDHGAVVGCLSLLWRDRNAISPTTLLQQRTFAEYLAPLIHSERALMALRRCSDALPRLEESESAIGRRYRLERLVNVLHDLLEPLVTGLELSVGFRPLWCGCSSHSCRLKEYAKRPSSNCTEEMAVWLVKELPSKSKTLTRRVPLKVAKRELGVMFLVYSIDEETRPPMHDSVEALVAMLGDAILDNARVEYGAILNNMQVELNSPKVSSTQHWLDVISGVAHQAGLSWVVAQAGDFLEPTERSTPSPVGLVTRLAEQVLDVSHHKIKLFAVEDEEAGVVKVLRLQLPQSKASLWLATVNKRFGAELETSTPWLVFLERLAEASDAALVRILADLEIQRLYFDWAKAQQLVAASTIMGTKAHQFKNFASSLHNVVLLLQDEITQRDYPRLENMEELLNDALASTEEFKELVTSIIGEESIPQGRRPSDLRQLIRRTHRFYQVQLREKRIHFLGNFEEWTPECGRVDLPEEVATLAIANLVSNAIDAIGSDGSVRVDLELSNGSILCRITDDGLGMAPAIRQRLFQLGNSDKPEGSGWGLFLTYRSLVENHAFIDLDYSTRDGTRFTIRFPLWKEVANAQTKGRSLSD